jgi:hypothetical protein
MALVEVSAPLVDFIWIAQFYVCQEISLFGLTTDLGPA